MIISDSLLNPSLHKINATGYTLLILNHASFCIFNALQGFRALLANPLDNP